MAKFWGNGDTIRGGSPMAKIAAAVILVGLIISGVLVGCSRRDARDRDVIPNHYLVVIPPPDRKAGFRDVKVLERAIQLRDEVAGVVQHREGDKTSLSKYQAALVGFSAVMSPATVEYVRSHYDVKLVPSKRMHLAAMAERPPFGLDRLGQRLLPMDRYFAANLTGEGVHVYVVDSGILSSNVQFANSSGGSRVSGGKDFINDGKQDCDGHGTHVAGTIGAIKYGIAKRVFLHSVRVVGCTQFTNADTVIAGLDWIIENGTRPAIINMSLSGPRYPPLDAAVQKAIDNGFIVIVAAGNVDDDHTDRNACNASPARVPAAITVGAMDPGKDRIAPFSFRGGCVDLFAPGVNILSARNDANDYGALMDGTSMASAHAAGVAALYLEACDRLKITSSAADVWRALDAVAGVPGRAKWPGFIKHPWFSPNKLLHWAPVVQPIAGSGSSSHWWVSRPKCIKPSPAL
ncbi:MAG: S8 family peptidase [Allosphingosinicella sp.]